MSGVTFKPWARDPTAEPSISDALQRARFERGPFRDITEASLQEELATQGSLELSDSEEEDDDENADAERTSGKASTREELFAVKGEMLQHVVQAEQDIARTLDYVSLVLSKDAPGTVAGTLSPWVKEKVPLGSFGVDLWQRQPVDTSKRAQELLLATNVRMQGLQQSADGLLTAAARLENNVRKETKYWGSILSVSDKGWNVCRVPKQQHRLAVTFGFGESSAQFSRKGIAALDADADGNVRLERGVGSRPEALRVVLKQNGKVVGRSKLPYSPRQDEMTIETRIRHARDSLFDEELFHEMIQESRSLASLGIRMQGDAVQCHDTSDGENAMEVIFELVRLDQQENLPSDERENDELAHGMVLGARLLLTHAHRERLHKRSEVPVVLGEKTDTQTRPQILRPILSLVRHRAALGRLSVCLQNTTTLLSVAEIKTTVAQAELALPSGDTNSADDLCKRFLEPWVSRASIAIYDTNEKPFTLQFVITTSLHTSVGSVYTLIGPDNRRFDYTTLYDLQCAVDPTVAAVLATQLGDVAPGTWKAIAREAMLERQRDDGTIERMWVDMDCASSTLVLHIDEQRVAWAGNTADGTSERRSFWAACKDLAKIEGVANTDDA
nr:mediator of rna polymerase ii transcription subunit 17 [Quercus suber]